MKIKFFILIICCLTSTDHATTWTGTSRTYGNTTYHSFHSNEVVILPVNPRYRDNSGEIAAGVAIGTLLGACLYKAFSKPKVVYQNNYYYNQYTNQYEAW